MITRADILAAEEDIKYFRKWKDQELQKSTDKEREETHNLGDAKWAIEKAICSRQNKGIEERKKIDEKFQEQIKDSMEIIHKKDFLLKCKHIGMREFKDMPTVTQGYSDKKHEVQSTMTLFVDDSMRLEVYIVTNDRPKKKFTVAVVGNCRILELMSEKPNGYGMRFDAENANIKTELFHAETDIDASNWIQKNSGKMLRGFIDEYFEIMPRFLQAIKQTGTDEWERLSLEEEKKYYETGYYRGKETPEYQEILKKLEGLKTQEERNREYLEKENNKTKKYYFPVKLVGRGKDEEEAWADAVDGFTSDPGIMDEFEESDEEEEE